MKEESLLNKKGSIFGSSHFCKHLCLPWPGRAAPADALHCSSPQSHQCRVGTGTTPRSLPGPVAFQVTLPWANITLNQSWQRESSALFHKAESQQCSQEGERKKYSRDMVINMHLTNQMSVKIKFTWLARVILHGGNWHIKLQGTGKMERRAKS